MVSETENKTPSTEMAPKTVDRATALGKGVLGALPVVGAFFAELIGQIIPNQRQDRIVRFAEKLNNRVVDIEKAALRSLANNPAVADVMEDSMFQAARALSDERLDHIANVVANGITVEQLNISETKRMLWLLGQLNDIEIILLRGLLPRTGGDHELDQEYQTKHDAALRPDPIANASSQADVDYDALHESYLKHLNDLALLSEYDVTHLGFMLLKYADLIPAWYDRYLRIH